MCNTVNANSSFVLLESKGRKRIWGLVCVVVEISEIMLAAATLTLSLPVDRYDFQQGEECAGMLDLLDFGAWYAEN